MKGRTAIDGRRAGSSTAATCAASALVTIETLGACVALAYIRHPAGDPLTPDAIRAAAYQINVGGHLYPATAHLRPPFDPQNHRVKGHYDNQASAAT